MSRYLLLVILNTPLIIAGILSSVVSFKLNHTSRRRLIFRITFWLTILALLIFSAAIYNFLFSNNLTHTEPLSLFDVMQITGIIFTFLVANQAYAKVDLLEHRVQDLHQELSIQLSQNMERNYDKKKS